ncbi:NlpC/P60 family protein [Pseudoroseicyclus aestuarii]|uniref:NlpC/P60 family protein n=1 Tax=Pseudoroseicyclus aestuarii TaxID=1795041 RepID=A0A318SRQ1_9RHOB|nr:NlpC/P60 family protein [Pseudoroseicyclus aestuarii]PYE84282.1 NlpC/P60 family protein [Pseudoroseicyclus aestuarii]
MSGRDRRLTPGNGRVALEGRGLAAERQVPGEAARVTAPVTALRAAPEGARDRQLISGEGVRVLERRGGWAFVQSEKDGYVGYLREESLGPAQTPTHRVAVPASHLYRDADLKSPDLAPLSFGALVTVTAEHESFLETPEGFIPRPHLRGLDRPFADPVAVARLHLGVPYLWGGNAIWGIDCSGLVQAALTACGAPCPGDSDMQMTLGVEAQGDPRPGDLWFWKGHVAMVAEPGLLIHAYAHIMAVGLEEADTALRRIEAAGDPLIARRRP